MYEDIGTIISNGFNTWKQNLNIAVPFILSTVAITILVMAMLALIFLPVISSLPESTVSSLPELLTSPENVEDLEKIMDAVGGSIENRIGTVVATALFFVVVASLVYTFFWAGGIGMAKEATEKGQTSLGRMWSSGKRHYSNLFLANALMILLMIVGAFVLILPIIIITESVFSADSFTPVVVLWLLPIILYFILISLALALMPYALVIEGKGPIDAIKTGINFFLSNKMDVFLVWLVILAVSMALGFVGLPFSESEIGSMIWQILSGLINMLVILPLTTVWWVRLYMTRTGKATYDAYENVYDDARDEEVKYL